jgi:hypothetical protein
MQLLSIAEAKLLVDEEQIVLLLTAGWYLAALTALM